MQEINKEKQIVCVTGAGGYLASWVVKFLLSKGYVVHGTVRDPCDEKKNAHLKTLENAAENLQLFKTDLLDYEGLFAAIAGCTGVFHIASPVPIHSTVLNPEVVLLEPAITGSRNVLNACMKAKVKKVVVVSSISAVVMNPYWPKDQAMDENCWTDTEYCKSIEVTNDKCRLEGDFHESTKFWYRIGKTIAESEALEYARRGELNLITVCPSNAIGPMLQSSINASSLLLLDYMKGERDTVENKDRPMVDVRDVAEAILLAYENPKAEGRYICSSHKIRTQLLVEKLKNMFPEYNYPTKFTEVKDGVKLNSQKLQNLGWKYRPLEETIIDAVKDFEESGLLNKPISDVAK
ncbi:unnamed protein product [Ilex paraguariensis]|uniref:NAD-dependent epimerase/dehydratase domain-containing protein n=1 Tax=Ilex paraguariensis TaxID=185542 RepID=A0ABC8T305_9AQUA